MNPRSLDDILRELDASYNPQKQLIQKQIDALPAQADAQIEGLKGQQTQAFGDILNGARSRGLGFSGIPLQEQAQYTSSQFLPAVAKVKQSQNETQGSLLGALSNINLDQNKYAQSIRQAELDRAEQIRQFNASQKSQINPFASLFSGDTAVAAPRSAQLQQRADKGFNFQDASGKGISAAQYAQIKGIPFRTLLDNMARAGDVGAKQALGYVGNDFGYNSAKVGTNQDVAKLLNSLLYGVNNVKARTPIVLNGTLGGSTKRVQG